uniref:Metallo-beta-lactamase domain-containing protein 1 n=2 Tax=Petromyzon marinus TaxID=7757 RepID=A0AAJ7XA98_PETMA|nr:metallo-beta-lactamase domain-containing protein 1 isoform X1 [Petromyzon marinus]
MHPALGVPSTAPRGSAAQLESHLAAVGDIHSCSGAGQSGAPRGGMAELSKTENLSTIPGVPYSVHVLREGYCYKDSDSHTHADGTVTLLLSVPGEAERPCAILVDTGGPWAKEELITSLQRTVQGCVQQSLAPSDVLQLVHTVVCTHGHSDHVGNVGLFPHARIIMGFDVSQGDLYETHGLAEGKAYVINPYVQVIPTPGHTCSDVSVVVRDTSVGTVVVAGDVFERSNDDDDWKEHSHDPVTQQVSRSKVASLADVIIPGHGPPFRVMNSPAATAATLTLKPHCDV